MRSLFSLAGALAGMMTAAAVFAQTPNAVYRPSTFQPAPHQTYYAQPTHGSAYGQAAQLWQPGATNVSYNRQPQVPPMGSGYAEALNANPYREQLEGHGILAAPHGSPYGYDANGTDCNAVDTLAFCGNNGGPRWFGYAGGLIMNRTGSRNTWLSYDTADYGADLMGTRDADMGWNGGYELRLGKHFGCENWAMEGVFWHLHGADEANIYCADLSGPSGTLASPLNFQGLTYGRPPGDFGNVGDIYGEAYVHRLRRSSDFYNVEVNFFQDPNLYTNFNSCGGFSVGLLGGLRFFRFADRLQFSASDAEEVFTGKDCEIHYGIDAENNLMGCQVGLLANYSYCGWNFYGGSKFGLFGNHINHRSRVYGGRGYAHIENNLSPNDGREFNIQSHRNVVSFLGELDLGASYQVTRCFSIRGGYRAVAVTGVALSTDQIPQNFEDLNWVASTQASSSVVLHGAYIGGEFVW